MPAARTAGAEPGGHRMEPAAAHRLAALRTPFLTALAFAMALSLGDLGAIALFGDQDFHHFARASLRQARQLSRHGCGGSVAHPWPCLPPPDDAGAEIIVHGRRGAMPDFGTDPLQLSVDDLANFLRRAGLPLSAAFGGTRASSPSPARRERENRRSFTCWRASRRRPAERSPSMGATSPRAAGAGR